MKDLLERKEKFMIERGWDNLPPSNLAKSIVIEAAELLEIFQWTNLTKKDLLADIKTLEKVKQELADIMIYALDLAITLDIDPKKIILEKIKKNEEKFPAKKMLGDNWQEEYLKIKKKRRESQ